MLLRVLIVFYVVFLSSELRAQNYPHTAHADISVLVGDGVVPVPGMQIFNGIRIEKWSIEPGLTIGVDVYKQFTAMPVSAGLKWIPFKTGPLLPYLSFTAGYSMSWLNRRTEEKKYRGGSLVNPLFGLRVKTRGKAILNFGVGYKRQRSSVLETITDDLGRVISITDEKYKLARISLSFGIGFSEIRFNSKAKLENIP